MIPCIDLRASRNKQAVTAIKENMTQKEWSDYSKECDSAFSVTIKGKSYPIEKTYLDIFKELSVK